MPCHRVEEFGPFRRATRISHVAGDEHEVEWMSGMDIREARHDTVEALVTARSAPTAFDAKTISLPNHVKVRKMGDAPAAAIGGRSIERNEIERLIHAGIREAPDERGDREITRHQNDSVGERWHDQTMQRHEVGHGADPTRAWPDENADQRRASAHHDAGAGGTRGAQPRSPGGGTVSAKHPLRQMAQRLAAKHVAGLNDERIERPEVDLG